MPADPSAQTPIVSAVNVGLHMMARTIVERVSGACMGVRFGQVAVPQMGGPHRVMRLQAHSRHRRAPRRARAAHGSASGLRRRGHGAATCSHRAPLRHEQTWLVTQRPGQRTRVGISGFHVTRGERPARHQRRSHHQAQVELHATLLRFVGAEPRPSRARARSAARLPGSRSGAWRAARRGASTRAPCGSRRRRCSDARPAPGGSRQRR